MLVPMTTNLQQAAITAIAGADFREFWPIEVRKTLVRAAKHEGEFPPYAEKMTRWALKDAAAIERRMAKDIEVGEAALSHAERRRLAVAK
jgi:hypothetical protein